MTLGEIAYPLGRKALSDVATAALPDTILKRYRRLVACKFDGSWARRAPGRLPIGKEIEELIVRMAKENRSWGYDRIVGALTNLGHQVSDQTVDNVLQRRRLLRRFRVGSRQSSRFVMRRPARLSSLRDDGKYRVRSARRKATSCGLENDWRCIRDLRAFTPL